MQPILAILHLGGIEFVILLLLLAVAMVVGGAAIVYAMVMRMRKRNAAVVGVGCTTTDAQPNVVDIQLLNCTAETRLETLNGLLARKAISLAEYEEGRRQILNDL